VSLKEIRKVKSNQQYTESHFNTVCYSAVRTILALAGLEDMEIHSLDNNISHINEPSEF